MHTHPRDDTIFAFDENHMDYPGQTYPVRSYHHTSSQYWNYAQSPAFEGPSQHGVLSSSFPHQRHPRGMSVGWPDDSQSLGIVPYPRGMHSYDASLRTTDHRGGSHQSSLYDSSNVGVWPSSHSSQWPDSSSSSSLPSWTNEALLPSIRDTYESKPVINHHLPASCSPLSTISSPSPSPSPVLVAPNSGRNSRRRSADLGSGVKMCSHCHATSTPLWRREPTTLKPLCNACGLYLQQRNKLRPQELIDADVDDESSDNSERDGTGPECSHCHTRNTSVWRRSKTGDQLCNACGVYSRLRGKDRPLSLKRNKIKPRTKHAKPITSLEREKN